MVNSSSWGRRRWRLWAGLVGGLLVGWSVAAVARGGAAIEPGAADPPTEAAVEPQQGQGGSAATSSAQAEQPEEALADGRGSAQTGSAQIVPTPEARYGLWVIAPPLAAIVLAILFRAVVPALVVGVLVGAYMLVPCLPAGDVYATVPAWLAGIRLAAERFVLGAITSADSDYGHAQVIVFTMAIGFMVGVIGRNGGTAGMVQLVAGGSESRRRGQLTAWLSGILVFFDDYANCMIVGPTMRPIFDRLRISRAKLAYIVDTTAAPVSSIFIGTWVGTEIGYLEEGLKGMATAPAFLLGDDRALNVNGMSLFWSSIPYRFYALFAIVCVFFVCLLGRDVGPMRRFETEALAGGGEPPPAPVNVVYPQREATPRAWLGFIPVLVLVGTTIAVLVVTGWDATIVDRVDLAWWEKVTEILGGANSYSSIFYGAIAAATVALVLTFLTRACSIRDAADAGLDGMTRVSAALVILVLAWALSAVSSQLMLGEVVRDRLEAAQFPVVWLPTVIFLAAALVSFATGTSWGTMGILTPMSVTIAAGLAASLPADQALPLFYSAIGAVLAGAVFGDHCSPISDTTVLSSLSSSCRHEDHVWTQFPYAVITAVVTIGCGNVVCDVLGQPWYTGLGAGVLSLLLILLIFGRRPRLPQGPKSPVSQAIAAGRSA